MIWLHLMLHLSLPPSDVAFECALEYVSVWIWLVFNDAETFSDFIALELSMFLLICFGF